MEGTLLPSISYKWAKKSELNKDLLPFSMRLRISSDAAVGYIVGLRTPVNETQNAGIAGM